jgi:hypothetical protein
VRGATFQKAADELPVAAPLELGQLVVDEGDAARHAGAEVAAGLAEDDRDTARHVFATVLAHALDDSGGAAVPDAEALARRAADEELAARGAVEAGVAGDHLL